MLPPWDLGAYTPLAVVQATRGGQSCGSTAWPVSGDGVENQSAVCQSCPGGSLVWSGCRTRMPQGRGEVTRGPAGLASVPMFPIGLPIREERQILTSLAGGAGRGDSLCGAPPEASDFQILQGLAG